MVGGGERGEKDKAEGWGLTRKACTVSQSTQIIEQIIINVLKQLLLDQQTNIKQKE